MVYFLSRLSLIYTTFACLKILLIRFRFDID